MNIPPRKEKEYYSYIPQECVKGISWVCDLDEQGS